LIKLINKEFIFYLCKFTTVLNTKDIQKVIGSNLQIFSELDSTNNYAMQLLHDGKAEPGMAILALCQTNGKGQRGKQWYTGKNNNLALSIILKTDFLSHENLFWLQLFASVAVCTTLQQHQINCTIKWPNDIFYENKKLGGILIENVWKNNKLSNSVVGIGINLNETIDFEKFPNATSLSQITNTSFDIVAIAQSIIGTFNSKWTDFKNLNTELYETYLTLLYKKNETITIKHQNEIVKTTLQTVNLNGQLLCGNQNQLIYNHGEIEWVL
jgi:BirA family transcriptional regulator, biotin operon repressor / biotin---[acetyl-CoA-carboxylase] ligase